MGGELPTMIILLARFCDCIECRGLDMRTPFYATEDQLIKWLEGNEKKKENE